MLAARRTTATTSSTPDRAKAARHRAAVRRHPRGEAGRRADPLRGRAGRRGARSQAQAAGPRPVDHGRRGRRCNDAVARKVFARGFKRDVRVAPDLVGADRAPAGARGARCARHRRQGRAGRGRLRQGRGGARPATGSSACCTPPTPAPTACRKLAGALRQRAGRRDDRRRSRLSRRPNWIWHWAGQMWYMQPCLPGLQATRFWRALRAWSAFGPASRAEGGPAAQRN